MELVPEHRDRRRLRGFAASVDAAQGAVLPSVRLIFTALLAVAAGACSDCGGPDVPPRISCDGNADCPGVELCIGGFCEDPAGISCESDDECPAGLICLENGRCRANTECQVDADCCADAANCASICEDFQCLGTECDVGDTEDCFVGCHRGA